MGEALTRGEPRTGGRPMEPRNEDAPEHYALTRVPAGLAGGSGAR
jgi:hypothetical protein